LAADALSITVAVVKGLARPAFLAEKDTIAVVLAEVNA
jgi:hypothetical protein